MTVSNRHPITCLKSGYILNSRYRIEALVGMGGMGQVYKATHLLVARTVAVKILHPERSIDNRSIQRFHQEAKIAGSLGSDNICEVIDMGWVDDKIPYLVMPFLSGCSLKQLIEKEEQPALHRVEDIACQILSALETAHANHIVHRDLKPDNVFVTKVGDRNDFVKLLDFGLSKVMKPNDDLSLSATGMAVGSPCYMAPEQIEGSKLLDHRADIYAAGIVLYEMLTGRRPFEGDSYNSLIAKILTQPFTLPRTVNRAIPKPVEEVILKAMARDPRKRYQRAYEMAVALKNAVNRFPNHSRETASNFSREENYSSTFDAVRTNDVLAPTDTKSSLAGKKHRAIAISTVTILGVMCFVALFTLLIQQSHSFDSASGSAQKASVRADNPAAPSNQPPSDQPSPLKPAPLPKTSISKLPNQDGEETDTLPEVRQGTSLKPVKRLSRTAKNKQKTPSEKRSRKYTETEQEIPPKKKLMAGHNNTLFLSNYDE